MLGLHSLFRQSIRFNYNPHQEIFMILLDTALEQRAQNENPVRLGIIGAGYIARGAANQILNFLPGMDVAAVSNRTVSKAETLFADAGDADVRHADSAAQLDEAVRAGRRVVTDNPEAVCRCETVDVIADLTGEIEFGARVTLDAIEHGKHVIASAEVDSVIGPILKTRADQRGVVYSNCDGDQPGVIMNLLRWVRCIGFSPVLAGNIKGMLDHERTPETQAAFAAKHGQTPRMATHFADGTKIAMEMAVVANATGFKTGTRGMYGPSCDHVDEAVDLFPLDAMLNGGLVDYILGAQPGPGVFVLGYNDQPASRRYADYFKRGPGPLHVFYIPYHFPHIELPLTAGRAALFADAAVTPLGAPAAEVITIAKTDLKAGDTLDGFGGFAAYGLLENHPRARAENLLPIGLSDHCVLSREIPKDTPVRFDDITLPEGRLCDRLYREQTERFRGQSCPVGRWNLPSMH